MGPKTNKQIFTAIEHWGVSIIKNTQDLIIPLVADDSADKSDKRGLDILADSKKRRTLAMDGNRRVHTIPRRFRVEPKLLKTGEKFVEKYIYLFYFFFFFDSTLACW